MTTLASLIPKTPPMSAMYTSFDSSTTVTYVVPTLVVELVMVAKAPETKSTSPMLFTTTLVSVEMLPKAFLPSDLRLAGRVISEIASVVLALQP